MHTTTPPLGVTAVMLPEIDFDEQLKLCQQLKLTHYSWRPRVIPEAQRDQDPSPWGRHHFDLTPQRLVKEGGQLRRRLESAGMISFGSLPAANTDHDDDSLQLHFEGAAAVGAGRVRVAPESYPSEGPFDYETTLNHLIDRYRHIVDLARPFKLKIVIETHSVSLATSPSLALNLCRPFSPDEMGVIFDVNNYMIEGGLRPNLAVAVIGRYIDHSHIGGARLADSDTRDRFGFRQRGYEMCPLPEADQNIPSWISALHEAGIHAPLIIENFSPHTTGPIRLGESVDQLQPVIDSLSPTS